MKKTKIIALISAFVFMLILSFTAFGSGNKTKVIVAAKDIPAHKTIGVEDLKIVEKDSDSILPEAINDPDVLLGTMTSSQIYKGESFLADRLYSSEDPQANGYGLSQKVTKGMRAVSIQVGVPEGVCSMLHNGNFVDVVLITKDGSKSYSKTILKNVKVIGLESLITESSDAGAVQYNNVTFELSPSDCNKLALASSEGRIWLTLRGVGDEEDVDVNSTSVTEL